MAANDPSDPASSNGCILRNSTALTSNENSFLSSQLPKLTYATIPPTRNATNGNVPVKTDHSSEASGGGTTRSEEEVEESNDTEGVWSSDIEQSFQEALNIYPPCGRRKIILTEEGKMYGRNELIARYIKVRTGKTRTRKQVSSHIQVMARRITKESKNQIRDSDVREKYARELSSLSSAQIVSARSSGNPALPVPTGANLQLDGGVVTQQPQPNPSMFLTQPNFSMDQFASQITRREYENPNTNNVTSDNPTSLLVSPLDSWKSPNQNVMEMANNTLSYMCLRTSPNGGRYCGNNANSVLNLSQISNQKNPFGLSINIPNPLTPKLKLVHLAAYFSRSGVALPESFCFQSKSVLNTHENASQWHPFVLISANDPEDPVRKILDCPDRLEALDINQIYDKFPDEEGLKYFYELGPRDVFFLFKIWGNVNTTIPEDVYFGTRIIFEGVENITLRLITKVASFGKQVVKKIEDRDPKPVRSEMRCDGELYRYHAGDTMCGYLVSFLKKLMQLKTKDMMDSVLENFSILQIAQNAETEETLLCLAYLFQVSRSECGVSPHKVFRLSSH